MRAWAIAVALLLCACHRRGEEATSIQAPPIDVAAAVAGCTGATDCERKCDGGVVASCVELGRLYEFGHVGARNPVEAYRWYERACGLGNAAGCYNQALLLEGGRGVARDKTRAGMLFRRVCQMGAKTACARAEEWSAAP